MNLLYNTKKKKILDFNCDKQQQQHKTKQQKLFSK